FSLISAPIDQQGLPVAVISFAQRFVAGASQSDRALLDFLMRLPPRLKGRSPGAPLQNMAESPNDAASRAVVDLDHSYLFIQGPPGTGKTYTAAEIAVLLLSKGHRVAISSNSHKAIDNALGEIEKRAASKNLHFRGAKKGSRDDPDTHFNNTNIRTVLDS